MNEFLARVQVDWPLTLQGILRSAGELGGQALLVFDLDSTVFDNRPRQARIVRDYGESIGDERLVRCQSFHFTSGWDLRGALVTLGWRAEEVEAGYRGFKDYWDERFFTSDYCRDDVEVVGAPRYLQACLRTGARLRYVTGRQEDMRAGTQECLRRTGCPPAGEAGVELLMKPRLEVSDDAFKRTVHQRLSEEGQLVAAFDNEPTHVNDYAVQFPAAVPVHLATDHSGRPVTLEPRVVSIPHFAY